ncbi:hypothetical protein PIB19_19515 [Sphingomonas sp. 7/4-4]|uniref:hypothetical protein n=1 Tax=Sphingomonas sp. 7/4-4 TaxID=3018446 RepID=UPI0022F3AB51|nr:hypothetical protein [Sphingomonas sp. 7/4-4]WBY07505.1 hypothetical protein PIB19_19515 [Sphingomonas sp. 7/4-4]
MATKTLPVTGNTPPVCAVAEPRLRSGNQINFRGLSGNTLQIDRMVDPATLAVSAASVDVRFDAVCNYPHRSATVGTRNCSTPAFGHERSPSQASRRNCPNGSAHPRC